MTPEAKARQQIDHKLEQAGWVIQDMKELNLSAGLGVAVREYPTNTGPADYVLFQSRSCQSRTKCLKLSPYQVKVLMRQS